MLDIADDARAVEENDGEAKVTPRFDGDELARHVAVVYGHGQHVNVAAICPNTREIRAATFPAEDLGAIVAFARSRQVGWGAGYNVYLAANPVRPDVGSTKAGRNGVGAVRTIQGDVDPDKAKPFPEERKRVLAVAAGLRALRCRPTVIIDSGGGVQVRYVLEEPLEATPESMARVERINRQLVAAVGGDASVVDVSHLMRAPGTINFPDAGKRKAGRTVAQARVIDDTGPRYGGLDEIEAAIKEAEAAFRGSPLVPAPAPRRDSATAGPAGGIDGLDLSKMPAWARMGAEDAPDDLTAGDFRPPLDFDRLRSAVLHIAEHGDVPAYQIGVVRYECWRNLGFILKHAAGEHPEHEAELRALWEEASRIGVEKHGAADDGGAEAFDRIWEGAR